jgi:hypothetical protein
VVVEAALHVWPPAAVPQAEAAQHGRPAVAPVAAQPGRPQAAVQAAAFARRWAAPAGPQPAAAD